MGKAPPMLSHVQTAVAVVQLSSSTRQSCLRVARGYL